MAKYPVYVNAYGKISEVFKGIKTASVPPKFTLDYLSTVLGLKSSSYRAMIPLLKKLNFLDQANIPTDIYKNYRENSKSRKVLGTQIKETYSEIYQAAEYAHKLSKDELTSKLISLLGVAEDDKSVPCVVGTFMELVKLSDFDGKRVVTKAKDKTIEIKKDIGTHETEKQSPEDGKKYSRRLGISYTINLNLPATTEIEVYNTIFKALKENLLYE